MQAEEMCNEENKANPTHTHTHSRRIYLGADKSIVSWKLGHFIDFVSGPRLHSPRVFPFSSASSSNNNNKKAEEDISLGFFLDVKNACHGTPLFPMKRRRGEKLASQHGSIIPIHESCCWRALDTKKERKTRLLPTVQAAP
jgi:hypothetical protein